MPCNCGKNKNLPKNFAYTAPDGTMKVYESEAQAMAAQIKNGGGTYVPVPK